MVGFTGVLAHQGGWDELLLVAAPIVVFVVLLRVANSRAAHLGDGPDSVDDRGDPPRSSDSGTGTGTGTDSGTGTAPHR